VDLTSRLRAIVNPGERRPDLPASDEPAAGRQVGRPSEVRELTYEPDDGYRAAAPLDLDYAADALGGRRVSTRFGECLVIDRRYESDRWHGDIQIGECTLDDVEALRLLDPTLPSTTALERTIFIDLETTGLSGGAGTLAFLVGCGYFDLGAFQVRQFLLTSHAAERALLAAVADFFDAADTIVTYNGKTFDVPVMETRWMFHRMEMPLDGVPHFDMLHPARRLWKNRPKTSRGNAAARLASDGRDEDSGCRLSTLERTLFDVRRVGDVPGLEIPGRFFRFVRSGNPNPLEPVLEHNRIDLVSLAAVTARAVRLAQGGHEVCRDCAEALALGKVFDRAEHAGRAEACFRRASDSPDATVRAEALYRLAVRLRRSRRFDEAAAAWCQLIDLTEPRARRHGMLGDLRQIAVEAMAIHQEHRTRDLAGARELALTALEEAGGQSPSIHHRLSRLDRKLATRPPATLFNN
jgi:uncharacterized protein YprB with RNaseH-like and TPR domain